MRMSRSISDRIFWPPIRLSTGACAGSVKSHGMTAKGMCGNLGQTGRAQYNSWHPNPYSSRDRTMPAVSLPCPGDAIADTVTIPCCPTLIARQRDLWASGSCAVVETTPQIVGEELCGTLDLQARKTLWMSPRVKTMPPLLPKYSQSKT